MFSYIMNVTVFMLSADSFKNRSQFVQKFSMQKNIEAFFANHKMNLFYTENAYLLLRNY